MTVVAAVARDGQVVMAADRQTNYENQAVFGARKVRRLAVGEQVALIAAAGNGALPNVLVQHLEIKTATPVLSADLAEVQDWADVVASAATEVLAECTPPLLSTDSRDASQAIDGALLLGFAGHLFYLFTHQAAHVPDGVGALGSGSDVALGAMHVALEQLTPEQAAVRGGVELACVFAPYCGLGPGGSPLIELA